MQSVASKIKRVINSKPRGELFFPGDFSDMGSSDSVRKALQQLKEKGLIKQVAHGIYVRPRYNELIGVLMPTTEEIALGIAKRDRIKIVPTGAYALNALGLSTQMPLNIVFLTDGAPRTIKVGNRSIKFKKTTPKNLLAKGDISKLVIQALREIGKGNVSKNEYDKIITLLKNENKQKLKYDIALAPEWIKKIMKKALDE